MVRDRLLGVELLRVCGVEAPEIREFACGVDFGLVHRLRLAEHRGRVQRRAPLGRQQLGRLQENSGAVFPCPVRPFAARGARGFDRLRHVRRRRAMPIRQHMRVIVGHHRFRRFAGANLAATDDERDVGALTGHFLEPRLQLCAFGGPRSIGLDRLVDWWRDTPNTRECGELGGDEMSRTPGL